jgi:hypothetical protein
MKNVGSLIIAVDKTPALQAKVKEVMDFVKTNWKEGEFADNNANQESNK